MDDLFAGGFIKLSIVTTKKCYRAASACRSSSSFFEMAKLLPSLWYALSISSASASCAFGFFP